MGKYFKLNLVGSSFWQHDNHNEYINKNYESKGELLDTVFFEELPNGIFKEIVAGALLVKHNNVVSIFTSGFNKRYNKILPNHFLHYSLINYYKENNYSFLDLNGISTIIP